MNLHDLPDQTARTVAIEAEQYVLGALLIHNDVIDRIADLKAEHFYRAEHRTMFAEIARQIVAGRTCDVLTLHEKIADKVDDCLPYLINLTNSTPSTANIARHAATVVDRAVKRALITLGGEIQDMVTTSADSADVLVDSAASRVEALSQQKIRQEPVRLSDSLTSYTELLTDRMEGKIKPIATGFADLDRRLDGGFERGTLTVLAARPGMGKSAMGLALCLNVAEWGSSAFLSMEMPKNQIHDRNVAVLGEIPINWLRKPGQSCDQDTVYWDRMTAAFTRAMELNFHIDDQTSLNMLEIRAKARAVKRKTGLDLLVIDQLSFITGGGSGETKLYEVVGEYTRALLALAKELDIAVVLLCQLNRKCEDRNNNRPILSDLALSGSIEQDAANVIFLYRDEIYNPDSQDKGVCEVICAKQRQGEPGTAALAYIANQTRFEDLARQWMPNLKKEPVKSRGFD